MTEIGDKYLSVTALLGPPIGGETPAPGADGAVRRNLRTAELRGDGRVVALPASRSAPSRGRGGGLSGVCSCAKAGATGTTAIATLK